jgi:molybdate transport system substrate-binding protein
MGQGHQDGGDPDPVKTLRILSGGAAHGLVEKIRPAFEAATGRTIDGTFSAVGAMRDKLLAGEPADVMILSRALIDELAESGHVVAASIRDVARVATSIAVRAGDKLPAMATSGDLREVLAAADEIHFPDPAQATAGIHFAKVIRELGQWDNVVSRLRLAPNGATAMKALAASTAAHPVGCTQETEIRITPGVTLVAPLPPGCDLTTVYTAAITTTAQAPAEAAKFIALLGPRASRPAS